MPVGIVIAMIAVPAVIVVALVLALTAGGSSESESGATAPVSSAAKRADRFDSARAKRYMASSGRSVE